MKFNNFLFVFCIMMSMTSQAQNFGQEFSKEEISKAIDNANFSATKKSINQIKPSEFSYYASTNQIENQIPIVARQKADTITKMVSNLDSIKYTGVRQVSELQQNGQLKPLPTVEYVLCRELKTGGCINKSIFNFFNLKNKSVVTYHNLKVVNNSFPVPELVLLRPDCGGRDLTQKKCEDALDTIEVSFDQVDWSSEPQPVLTSYKITYSGEVPFFGAQIQNCGSTTIPYQQQRIALMQCETLKDFTFGHD